MSRETVVPLRTSLAARLGVSGWSALPPLGVLVVVWIVFQIANPSFLSSANLVNIAMQSAATGLIALGVVFVLIAGQIDLSVGAVASLAGAIIGILFAQSGWPAVAAILVALLVAAGIGALYGFVVIRFRAPGFVVTLAGLLGVLGAQSWVLRGSGSIGLPVDSWLVTFAQQAYLPDPVAYVLAALGGLGWTAARVVTRLRRIRAGLPYGRLWTILLGGGLLLAALLGGVWYLGLGRGVGAVFVVFVGAVVVADTVLRRTRWGRALHAVGGGEVAARRVGIRTGGVMISAFIVCSVLAAVGGILGTARLAAAVQGGATDDVYLTAIAAAVIGGTSLFGGRGSAWSALLGIVIITSLGSGFTLLALDSSTRLLITGAVLLAAVIVDSLARARRR
jgi:simple sugar transport system permease protein/D-xylose transport system permease protein